MKTPEQRELEMLYARVKGESVAFVDETYLLPEQALALNDERPYYVLTAVVVKKGEFPAIREDLAGAVPRGWFHATDMAVEDGGTAVKEVLSVVDPAHDCVVLAHHVALSADDPQGESARADCFEVLLEELYTPSPAARHDAVRAVVVEARQTRRHNDIDMKTRKRLIGEGVIGRDMEMRFVSSRHERLLWLPDAISWSYRQKITGKRDDLMALVDGCTRVLPPKS